MKNHLNLEVLTFDANDFRLISNLDFGYITIGIYETKEKALKVMNSLLINN